MRFGVNLKALEAACCRLDVVNGAGGACRDCRHPVRNLPVQKILLSVFAPVLAVPLGGPAARKSQLRAVMRDGNKVPDGAFPLDHKAHRRALHTPRRQTHPCRIRQGRADKVAAQAVKHTPRLLRGHQGHIQFTRCRDRSLNGAGGDFGIRHPPG